MITSNHKDISRLGCKVGTIYVQIALERCGILDDMETNNHLATFIESNVPTCDVMLQRLCRTISMTVPSNAVTDKLLTAVWKAILFLGSPFDQPCQHAKPHAVRQLRSIPTCCENHDRRAILGGHSYANCDTLFDCASDTADLAAAANHASLAKLVFPNATVLGRCSRIWHGGSADPSKARAWEYIICGKNEQPNLNCNMSRKRKTGSFEASPGFLFLDTY
jgi:hypothetical protein